MGQQDFGCQAAHFWPTTRGNTQNTRTSNRRRFKFAHCFVKIPNNISDKISFSNFPKGKRTNKGCETAEERAIGRVIGKILSNLKDYHVRDLSRISNKNRTLFDWHCVNIHRGKHLITYGIIWI